MSAEPDLVLLNGKITTLDRAKPAAQAVAIKDGRITSVGGDREIGPLASPKTKKIELGGRRLVPGLIDSHTHIIRGGLSYNMELRWDGVRSLADAMRMLKGQVDRTPAPQWVRVVGGFTEHQFAEKRLPTLGEINTIAPDTPVFILHLYDRALLNRAALRAIGYTKDTPAFPASEMVRDANGEPTGLLIAKPNATILYATLAKGPKLPPEYQKNSTLHFMRELKSSWHYRRDRCRRRFACLSRRSPDHRRAAPRGETNDSDSLQPVYPETEAGTAGFCGVDQAAQTRAGRRYVP